MFELPDAKRVRRSDLYRRSQSASSPSPSEPDPELEARLRARLASLYGLASDAPVSAPPDGQLDRAGNDQQQEEEEEVVQEFEFRLFSSASGKGGDEYAGSQKIVLSNEEEAVGDGGFLVRERGRGYYFAEKAEGETKRRFEFMAMSGDEVLSRAKRRAWGLEVPWRVRIIKVRGKKDGGMEDAVVGTENSVTDGKRKSLGKKRRVILRKRKKSREEQEERKRVENEKKDEAEREKKTRRNREKKVKRKMKERAKKSVTSVQDGNIATDSGEPSGTLAGDNSAD